MSAIKYTNREKNTQKFGDPLENMGMDKYIKVKANTNALKLGLPYLSN